MTQPRILLNQNAAARALGMSVNTFKKHVRPHVKRVEIGRTILFPNTELVRWAEEHSHAV